MHKKSFKKSRLIYCFFLFFFVQLYQTLQQSQLILNISYESIHGQARAIKMTFYRCCSARQKRKRKKSILLNKINYNHEIYRCIELLNRADSRLRSTFSALDLEKVLISRKWWGRLAWNSSFNAREEAAFLHRWPAVTSMESPPERPRRWPRKL